MSDLELSPASTVYRSSSYCLLFLVIMFPSIPFFNLVSVPFKRAQLGLFHGKTKQFGNSVPNSKHKTRRSWLPNVHNHRLLSETLGQRLRIKVTTRALKTITKASALRARIQSL